MSRNSKKSKKARKRQYYQQKKSTPTSQIKKNQISSPEEELKQSKQTSKGKQANQGLKTKQSSKVAKAKQNKQTSKGKQVNQGLKTKQSSKVAKTKQSNQTVKAKQNKQASKAKQTKQNKQTSSAKKSLQNESRVQALRPSESQKVKKAKEVNSGKKGSSLKDSVTSTAEPAKLKEVIASNQGKIKSEKALDSPKVKVKKKKWRILKFFFLFLLIISLLIIGYGVWLVTRVNNLITDAYVEIEQEIIREVPLQFGEEPFSVLLLGIDVDDLFEENSLSDAIMLMTVNPNENSTKILSLSRYMVLNDDIETLEPNQRLGFEYALGGPGRSVNTIQDILDVPIDRFVVLDMVGFGMIIDELDGISIYNNTLEFSQGGEHFPLGPLTLNGDQALSFIRMRREDPQGDFGRQARQRLVVNATLSLIEESIILRHNDILSAADDHIFMNFRATELVTVLRNYLGATANVTTYDLRGEFLLVDYQHLYVIVDDEDIAQMSEILRNHLELD